MIRVSSHDPQGNGHTPQHNGENHINAKAFHIPCAFTPSFRSHTETIMRQ
jgi:hypothetical protein